MKITFVVPWLDVSGGNRVIYELANRLAARSHRVTIVYPLVPLAFSAKPSLKNIVRQLYYGFKNILRGNKVDWFKVKAELVRVFCLHPLFARIPAADAIIAASSETANYVAGLPGDKGEKYYFPQHYEVWDLWNSESFWCQLDQTIADPVRLGLAMAAYEPEERNLFIFKKKLDATYKLPLHKITTSLWLEQVIEKISGVKIAGRIRLGINFVEFYPAHKSSTRKTILAPYRNIGSKGDQDVIEAFRLVRERYSGIRFILYGTRQGKHIPAWIEFYQLVIGENLRRLYCEADLFVYPSWVEGYGLPPLEAMACGIACVTTNVGAVADYSIADKTAVVVPPRNPRVMAEACGRLLMDDQERTRIAQAGYEYVKQFTWDKPVADFEKILQGTVG